MQQKVNILIWFSSNVKNDEGKDGKFSCKHCNSNNKNDTKLIYDVELQAQESLGSDKVIKLRLNTFDDEGVLLF